MEKTNFMTFDYQMINQFTLVLYAFCSCYLADVEICSVNCKVETTCLLQLWLLSENLVDQ